MATVLFSLVPTSVMIHCLVSIIELSTMVEAALQECWCWRWTGCVELAVGSSLSLSLDSAKKGF